MKYVRLARIVINSFVGCLLILIGSMLWTYNPLYTVLLLLASFDQFEDVVYYAWGRRLLPEWLMPLDIAFEGACIALGAGILAFSVMYMSYFRTWFFQTLVFFAIPIIWSSIEDILQWGLRVRGVVCAFREEKRFVRRK